MTLDAPGNPDPGNAMAPGNPTRRSKPMLAGTVATALAAGFGMPANAALLETEARRLHKVGQAVVTQVIDGDTLLLSDGRTVRLLGVTAPKFASVNTERAGARPLRAEQAKAELATLVDGRTVVIATDRRVEDRYGRLLAHIFLDDAPDAETDHGWVQGALVDAGLVRVSSFADNRTMVQDLLAREARARVAGRGLWSDPAYRVRSATQPEDIARRVGRFEIVEGTVLSVGEAGGRLFLNFGTDFAKDFTVVVVRRDVASFQAEGTDLKSFANRKIRVRGWVELRGGPMMAATHPEQIELLTE